MNGKVIEKRVLKGYKIRNSIYDKAMKRAKKENTPLATLVEEWIRNYANGSVFFNDSSKK
jgi:hypothetical protein